MNQAVIEDEVRETGRDKEKAWVYSQSDRNLPDGQYQNQIDYTFCSQRWRSSTLLMWKSAKTRPEAECGSDHELLIASGCSCVDSGQGRRWLATLELRSWSRELPGTVEP